MTEDKLRDEAQRLMEEKEEYQEVAKETLKKLADDKLEAVVQKQQTEQVIIGFIYIYK
jgi:molybdenum-dependent DNA-binding transcriptional regulator ModE